MAGQKTMFSLRDKRRLVKKSEDLNKYGPFFIIFPLPVMLKFTVHFTAVHLFTCVAKAVTSRRSREYFSHNGYSFVYNTLLSIGIALDNSVESDLRCRSRIYFDDETLTSTKPYQHNNKCDCSKANVTTF